MPGILGFPEFDRSRISLVRISLIYTAVKARSVSHGTEIGKTVPQRSNMQVHKRKHILAHETNRIQSDFFRVEEGTISF